MLGISASIFNEAGSVVRDWLKNPLNSAFFFWYFLPAAGFVLVQLLVIGPAFGRTVPEIFSGKITATKGLADLILNIFSASFFQLILLPLILGVVLSALSARVLRLYQGTLPIARPLFQPWLTRNRRRNVELYTKLRTLRRQYLFLVSQGVLVESSNGEEKARPVAANERDALIEKLKQETQAIHDELESQPATELPVDIDRVGATDIANTLALAEAYPFERYAMDAAVFWPRLSAELEPEKADALKSSFGTMNGLLNLSLLIFLLALEFLLLTIAMIPGWATIPLAFLPANNLVYAAVTFVVALLLALLGYGAYRAAVSSARTVGNAMRTAFDYYRGNVLQRFNLKMPNDLEEERVLWLKLGAFIRRGESFYYPSNYRRGGEA